MTKRIKKLKKSDYHKNNKECDVYTNIDWEKASLLFQKTSVKNTNIIYPSVKDILRMLAGLGTLGLVFACPKAAIAFAPFIIGNREYTGWRTKTVFDRLTKQKDTEITYNANGTATARITKRGMQRALTYQLDNLQPLTAKKWDKKWRIVIFDIPEKYRRLRDIFRRRIEQLGLYQLQESVFVSPYQCFDEVEFLRELYGVAFSVRYVVAEKIEEDEVLRNYFSLT